MANQHNAAAARFQSVSEIAKKVKSERLDGRDVRRLTNVAQVVRVVSGLAWITVDGDDILVARGEKIALKPGHYAPVISSVNGMSLVYEVWR